jgi:signal transduction histidine kinase
VTAAPTSSPSQCLRPRSLRQWVVAVLALGFLLLSAAQFYISGNFIERQLLQIESKDVYARLGDVHHAFEVMKEDLTATTSDWAQWDSTYEFVNGLQPDFAAANLYRATFERLRLDLVVLVDRNGRTVFAKVLGPDGELADAPPDIAAIAQGGALSSVAARARQTTGLVSTATGIYLLSSQAVLNSAGNATPRGRLIMGRTLRGFVRPALERMTGERLEIAGSDAPDVLVADERTIRRYQGRDTLIISADKLYGYTPLDDLWGKPVVQLAVPMERPMQAMLSEARGYLLIANLIVGAVFCVAGLLLIRTKVVGPLERLATAVETIGVAGEGATRVPVAQTAREFETLSLSINAMLEQIEQQQAIRRDRDAAVEANRLKSEFLATMSHEIRTPMNGVLGMCELLQRTELNPRQRHLSDTVLRSARSLLEILNDILDFSKIEAGKLELELAPFSPSELVQSVAAPFVPVAQEKGLEFTVRMEHGVPQWLVGDALRLRQVLNNLLSNAIKFTEKGSICLSCSAASLADHEAELRFAVTDTGIGVAPSAQQHIFDPFAQAEAATTRRFGGTGLGLAIVRRLVTLMGGQVHVQSEAGRGSTFSFTAMLQRAEEQAAHRPSLDATGPRFSIAHAPAVLLAEDNAVNREVLTEMLEHIGCRVTAVENGALVLAACASRGYDAILMDCQMPVMDGHTAAMELRALEGATARRRAFIIALTADATAENRQRCLEAGMDAVVTKPIAQANLRNLILRAVRPADPALA